MTKDKLSIYNNSNKTFVCRIFVDPDKDLTKYSALNRKRFLRGCFKSLVLNPRDGVDLVEYFGVGIDTLESDKNVIELLKKPDIRVSERFREADLLINRDEELSKLFQPLGAALIEGLSTLMDDPDQEKVEIPEAVKIANSISVKNEEKKTIEKNIRDDFKKELEEKSNLVFKKKRKYVRKESSPEED
jgi:hypothetical protein